MRFDLIPPDNLHSVWPYVKRGLERVREVSGERWLPEDVYTHIRLARAQLFLGYDGDHCRGFFITQNLKDAYTNEPYLNVWVLWAEPTTGDNFAGVGAFVGETMDYLDAYARSTKAQTIRMYGRRGWERYLKDYFLPVKVEFERKVNYGR